MLDRKLASNGRISSLKRSPDTEAALIKRFFYCQNKRPVFQHRPLRFARAFTVSYMVFMALISKPALQVLVYHFGVLMSNFK